MLHSEIAIATPSKDGIWSVSRESRGDSSLLERVDDNNRFGGNRFDSFNADYETTYFGSTLEACFAETLARFRPNPKLVDLVRQDGEDGKMQPGGIASGWRFRRVIKRIIVESPLPFVNIGHPETLAALNCRPNLMASLGRYGVNDIDVSVITGKDRRVTRFIAQYLYDAVDVDGAPQWSGIRYVSRLGESFECWAIFDRTIIRVTERLSIEKTNTDLVKVAQLFGLTVH